MYSVRKGLADAGAEGAHRIALFEQLMDSQTLVVTANTSTLYTYTYTDLAKDGPTVIEIPPGMLGFLNDAWQRFVGNMGVTGPDEGKGGKYLVVPPGYTGEIPDGYFVLKPPTNRNFMFLRGSIAKGLEPAVENITSKLRVYPLKEAANPVATEFVNMSNKAYANKNPSFESDGTMGLDPRVLYYFNAGGVTPAMATTRAGEGSDYALAVLDAEKKAFDGSKTYRLHLPRDVPVK